MTVRAEAVAKELAEVKGTIEAKIQEIDNKIGVIGGEVTKLPAMEAQFKGMEQRLTEYTERGS